MYPLPGKVTYICWKPSEVKYVYMNETDSKIYLTINGIIIIVNVDFRRKQP